MSRPSARFVGNDVVDLTSPLLAARAGDSDELRRVWRARHLTERERNDTGACETFWQIFAVKEAASKALAQAGVAPAPGVFRDFEVSLSDRSVTHLPTGRRSAIAVLEVTDESIHAVVVHPEGPGADGLAASVESVPPGASASPAAREALAALLARESGGGRADRFAVTFEDGLPRILDAGVPRNWSVSLSHAGRFVAACALLP